VSDPEVACEDTIYSGGGFSNYFGMPDYQKTAVQGYLSANPISYAKNIYNSTGVCFRAVSSRSILIIL
jgi:tripeptidyl-peptidase-1